MREHKMKARDRVIVGCMGFLLMAVLTISDKCVYYVPITIFPVWLLVISIGYLMVNLAIWSSSEE